MNRLTCEMCGSTNLIKQDGVFVCQTCGVKYSVEEAKKMMIEGTVDVSGSTVKIDNTNSIDTFMSMAKSAYNAGNLVESETYCNKVIEIDPNNYDAWMLKGRSSGWQSSLGNIRIGETINCFITAIACAPEEPQPFTFELMGEDIDAEIDIRIKLINESVEEIDKIFFALEKLQGDRFAKWPDLEEAQGLLDIYLTIAQAAKSFLTKIEELAITMTDIASQIIDILKPLNEFPITCAEIINESVVNAWSKVIIPEYQNANDGHPDDCAFDTFLERANLCITLLKGSNEFSKDDDESDIVRYKKIIEIHRCCIISCSYDYSLSPYTYEKIWYKSKTLAPSAKAGREHEINLCESKILQCEENIRKKKEREANEERIRQEKEKAEQRSRNKAYWEEHSVEKGQLESEKNNLQEELKRLREEYKPYEKNIASWKRKREEDTPSVKEKTELENKASQLQDEIRSLGLFKGKEKKELQAQIDKIYSRLSEINKLIEDEKARQINICNAEIKKLQKEAKPITDKANDIQNRINDINTELTKDR